MELHEIIEELVQEFPKFRIINKSKSKLMKFLYVALFMEYWNPLFMERYITVLGSMVYVPDHIIKSIEKPNHYEQKAFAKILRHERVHMRDSKGWRWPLFALSYLILPIGPSFRAYWELRGYRESMVAKFESDGNIPDQYIDSIASQFTSSAYLFMWPFPKHIKKILNRYRDEIKAANP